MSKTQEADAMSDKAENTVSSLILPVPEDAVKVAVILSPVRKLGQRKRKRYAQKLATWVVTELGDWPTATHIMLEGITEPGHSKEADELALSFQRSLIERCDYVVAGIDYGVSAGMKNAVDYARLLGKEVRFECIGLVDNEVSDAEE